MSLTMHSPVPAGRVLRDLLPPRTRAKVAKTLGITLPQLRAILNGNAPVTPALAERLSVVLPNSNAGLWNRLQAQYEASLKRP